MAPGTVGLIVGVVVLALAAFLILRRQGRAPARAPAGRPAAQPANAQATGGGWAPPRYDAAAAAAPTGPSLKVGVNIIRPQADSVLVSWNALIDGSEPVQVQWGAPQIRTGGGNALELRYVVDTAAAFQAPETRLCQPGEILSRSVNVARAAVGQDVAGMRVTVVLGYGPAAGHAAACVDEPAYLAWQRTAVSAPRTIPKG